MTNTFHPVSRPPRNTHLDYSPSYLQDIITSHQTVKGNVVAQQDKNGLSDVTTGINSVP